MRPVFNRHFAMPSADTFSIKPIGDFVRSYLDSGAVSVDPFARNNLWATHSNDINPNTAAKHHLDAEEFLKNLAAEGVLADVGIFDPPYSPRQIAEHYREMGAKASQRDTQNARLYRRVRDALDAIIRPGGFVLSFGWQSVGMGVGRHYEMTEVMLVVHGGGHNDTICTAERKLRRLI